jgi:hypothetical protein
MRALLALLLVSAFLVQPVHGQSQQQRVVIFHDVMDDGYTYVGTPNQFAFALLNEDGSPNVHKNGRVTVTQNGVVLYETPGYNTAHDYDALNTFLVTFPVEGRYEIQAEIGSAPETSLKASFSGYVERRTDLAPVTLKLDGPATAMSGQANKFSYQVTDANGSVVPHSDGLFEVRNDATNQLLFRTHTHSHEGPQELSYVFANPGTYSVKLTGFQAYPTKADVAFAPLTTTKKVQVSQGNSDSAPGVPGSTPSLPGGIVASPKPVDKGYRLYTTYDPDKTVGLFGNQRLNTYVFDPVTGQLVPHIDFTATLKDPSGRVLFSSETLHEYDGHLEVITANNKVGTYRMEVKATDGEWSDTRTLVFDVAPPVVGGSSPNPSMGAGPMLVTSRGLDKLTAGTPQPIVFTASTAGGAPWQHSEIDLQVNTKDGVSLYLNKLHTHSDGLFNVNVNFPTPGDYVLILDAEPVHRDAATSFSYGKLGDPIVVPVKVAPGVAIPDVPVHAPEVAAAQPDGLAPAPSLFLIVVAVFVGLGFQGRRP